MSRLRSFWTSKRRVWATLKRCEIWNLKNSTITYKPTHKYGALSCQLCSPPVLCWTAWLSGCAGQPVGAAEGTSESGMPAKQLQVLVLTVGTTAWTEEEGDRTHRHRWPSPGKLQAALQGARNDVIQHQTTKTSLDKNDRWNLEEVLDQRSGGCEASAGSDPPVEGWELSSGSSFLWEESGEGVLESSS